LGLSQRDLRECRPGVFEAAAEVQAAASKQTGNHDSPGGFKKELDLQVEVVHRVRRKSWREEGEAELPGRHDDRSSARRLTADEIAETAEFFSFGTNDLTQMCSA
jgi:pyruvate,orthophosphate dikinase